MNTITHNTLACMDIESAAAEILKHAQQLNRCVHTEFNGQILEATPSDTVKAIIEHWDAAAFRKKMAAAEVTRLQQQIEKIKTEHRL